MVDPVNRLEGSLEGEDIRSEVQINQDKLAVEIKEAQDIKEQMQKILGELITLKGAADESFKNVKDARHFAEENSSIISNLKVGAESATKAVSENLKATLVATESCAKDAEATKKGAAEVLTAVEAAKRDQAQTKAIAEIAAQADKQVTAYEKKLDEKITECEELRAKIDGLLPGATSASLASAFENRRRCYATPRKIWAVLTVLSTFSFIAFGAFIIKNHLEVTSLSEWFFRAITKSPIILGLILLEEFSRRNYHRNVRLEEEYAHKEVLSKSFEGYRKQMEGIGGAPLGQLSMNLLEALKESPVRLVDRDRNKWYERILGGPMGGTK